MRGEPSLSVLSSGVVLAGRYRIGQVLGQGGMGIVLDAWDQTADVAVAVKVLQSEGTESAERFFREARLVSRLESEHVVGLVDVGMFQGRPFMVMDRLVGEDFGVKVRAGPLALDAVADCIVQACEALAHAHRAGIVHRDIKASNLFEHSGPGGSIVKVLDFGISKALSDGKSVPEHTLTRSRDGTFLGSPPYMSPEQIRSPRGVDARTDIWSLGVVAYRLLSAEFPFQGESTGELLLAIVEKPAPRLRDLGVDVPIEVDAIVSRCLSRSREDRFSDVGVLAAAFAPFASPRWRHYGEHVRKVLLTSTPEWSDASARRRSLRPVGHVEPGTETQAPAPAPPVPLGDADTVLGEPDLSRPPTPQGVRRNDDPGTMPLWATPHVQAPAVVRNRPRRVARIAVLVAVLASAALGGVVFFTKRHAPEPAPQATIVPPEEPPRPAPSTSLAPLAAPPPAPTSAAIEAPSPPRAAPPGRPAKTKPPARITPAPAAAATSSPPHARQLEPNPYTE